MRTVLAVGGNAIASGKTASNERQRDRIQDVVAAVARRYDREDEIVLTHGNGPQIGQRLLQQEQSDSSEQPLDVLVAETQAQVGYRLASNLEARIDSRVTTLLTRVRVDATDPEFETPSKPVGPYYSEAEAAAKPFETGPVTTPEGDRAYRRLVPSPRPMGLLEADQIRTLVAQGTIVVCGGGGGVPVVSEDDRDASIEDGDGDSDGVESIKEGVKGVEVVVDKDYTTGLVGDAVEADRLVMVTDVPFAYRGFGTDSQEPIQKINVASMRRLLADGAFAEGSMRPKVAACLDFLDDGGTTAIITSPQNLAAALDGETGTQISR